jgi:hypothetical protein
VKTDLSNWPIKFLGLFLATDIVFIIIHIFYLNTDLVSNPYFSIEQDRGYAEFFQYIKEYWIALLLGWLGLRNRSILYGAWSLLFLYLLLDDSCSVHEKLGLTIGNKLSLLPTFNLRSADLGELIVSAGVGLFFLVLIAIAYRFGDRLSRKTSRHLVTLLFALALFGIVIDLLHIALPFPSWADFLGLLEDGGEMVVMSIIAWLVFSVSERSEQYANSLQREPSHPNFGTDS